VSPGVHRRVNALALRLDCPAWYLLDALIRSLSDDEIVKRVVRQRERDGAARASWSDG
jgi:hypothetical protein